MKQFAIAVVLFLLALACPGCMLNLFSLAPDRPEETFYAQTPDGWDLAIYRYAPKTVDPKRPPVILCHGMACNHTFWNLADHCDFTRYLANAGWDVYTLDLRGHGKSFRSNRFKGLVAAPGMAKEKKDPYSWTVDDYIRSDVPAVIDAVLKKTGQSQVTWIGHSMGGMVMYGFLETDNHPERVKNFVTLGSPCMIPQPPSKMLEEEAKQPRFLRHSLLTIGFKAPAQLLAPVAPLMNTPLDILYYNRSNVETSTVNRMYVNCLENIPVGVSDQMMDMILTGDFQTADQKYNYFRNLSRVKTPILLIAAKVDNCSPPMVVNSAYHAVSSKDKTYVELSLADRNSIDYGHCDMIWGPRATQEVYPVILKWLEGHK